MLRNNGLCFWEALGRMAIRRELGSWKILTRRWLIMVSADDRSVIDTNRHGLVTSDKQSDALVKRTTEAMRLPAASDRNISSLLNWVNGTGSISRSETSFLQRSDLCALGASNNQGLAGTKSAVEWVFIQVYSRLLKVFVTL